MAELESIVLVQKRPKIIRIALFLAYSFFVLNGIGGIVIAIATGIPWLMTLIILASIGVIAFGGYLLKMNRDPELTVTASGFSERTETDYRAFKWSDVEGFEVYSFRAQHHDQIRIGFNFSPSFRRSKAYKKVRLSANTQRMLTGYAWYLSNNYGKDPKELAALMNHYHQAN